jgi:hypothetical protein
MAKTPLILETRQKLRLLGDQLYYTTFVDELVALMLEARPAEDLVRFTAEAFPESKKAPRIHIPLARLAAFRDGALSAGFGAVVVASYEVCDSYMVALPQLLQRLSTQTIEPQYSDKPEENARLALIDAASPPIDAEVFETLKYVRLRRNHIAHLREDPTKELAALIRQRGTHLYRYWDEPEDISFSDWPSEVLSEGEAVGLLKYLRVCIERIDEAAGQCLDDLLVIEQLNAELVQAQPNLRHSSMMPRRTNKIEALAEMLYGRDIDPQRITDHLNGLTS